MCNLDYDRPDFYTATTHRARCIHKCEECRRLIQKGERYVRSSGKWEGRVDTFKHCLHCNVLVSWLNRECGGFMHGGVIGEIEEHVREYGVPAVGFSLARMYVNAGRKWDRHGQLLPVPAIPLKSLHDDDAQRHGRVESGNE